MKSISPFIAVILLIALVVATGSIIFLWFIPFIKKQAGTVEQTVTTELECTRGGIWLHEDSIKCNFTATDPHYRLNFTVENTGEINLYNLRTHIDAGGIIYGPYEVHDYLTNNTFNSTFPLRPGYKRTVFVNITESIPATVADKIDIITQCTNVKDEVTAVTCG